MVENYPKIERPTLDEVDMLDCTIDVTDKDMPIELAECIYEHKKYFYVDLPKKITFFVLISTRRTDHFQRHQILFAQGL